VRIASGIVLAVGIIAVSTASIFIRYAQSEAPSLVIATYRLVIASLVLMPVAWQSRRAELRSLGTRELGLGVAAGVFLALHFATWVTSLEYTTVASSVVLVSTSPVWVSLAAWILLRERLTRPEVFGLVLAVGGSLVVGLSDTVQKPESSPLLGNALALIGALMVAGYWLIGRRLRQNMSLTSYVAVVYGTAAAVLLIMTGAARLPLTGYQPIVYVWLLLLGLIPQLIGHSSFNWALARLPATFVAVATLGEPIGSTTLAYFLLGEAPTLLKIFGALLVFVGIVLTLRHQANLAPSSIGAV